METTLRCVFEDSFGRNVVHSLTNADNTATGAAVRAFMEACIANAEIFPEHQRPVVIVGAEFINREVTTINL